MDRVLPQIVRVARRFAPRTIFTRFIPPRRPDDMPGAWRRYYERWRNVTRENLDPQLLELVEPLAQLTPPAGVHDKMVYSPFTNTDLGAKLRQMRADTIVVTGAETDVCVLATVLGAIDLGYRTVLVRDAVCSSSDAGHDALITMFQERFTEQLAVADADTLLAHWKL